MPQLFQSGAYRQLRGAKPGALTFWQGFSSSPVCLPVSSGAKWQGERSQTTTNMGYLVAAIRHSTV